MKYGLKSPFRAPNSPYSTRNSTAGTWGTVLAGASPTAPMPACRFAQISPKRNIDEHALVSICRQGSSSRKRSSLNFFAGYFQTLRFKVLCRLDLKRKHGSRMVDGKVGFGIARGRGPIRGSFCPGAKSSCATYCSVSEPLNSVKTADPLRTNGRRETGERSEDAGVDAEQFEAREVFVARERRLLERKHVAPYERFRSP